MFNKKLKRQVAQLEHEIGVVQANYWELRRQHAALLRHLGLAEQKVLEHTKLVKLEEE